MGAKVGFGNVEFIHGYNDIRTISFAKVRFSALEFKHNYYDIKIFGLAKIRFASTEFVKYEDKNDPVIETRL